MKAITDRQKELLQLLYHTKGYVTADWLARKVGVSDRTLRNEINILKLKNAQLGIEINSVRGKGYSFNINDISIFRNLYRDSANNEPLNKQIDFSEPSNRVNYMIKRFLMSKDYIKLDIFEDEMFVSKSTIQHDLKILRMILDKYKLTLVNRPHYGSKVMGDEYMKRLCLSHSIINRDSNLIIPYSLIDNKLYDQVKKIIISQINKYEIDISDISLENLTTHIVIACKRIASGFIIKKFQQNVEDEYPFEKKVATDIVKEIEKSTHFYFNRGEIDYIIIHLASVKLLRKDDLIEYGKFDQVKNIVDCILKRLSDVMNWNFRDDPEFIQALTLHLRPAMNRIRYHITIRNPLLNEIKEKHPVPFEGAIIASKCIEEYIGQKVDENEIAYIALYIGTALEKKKRKRKMHKKVIVVCASGLGSAKLLCYRLQHLFNYEIDIVGTTSFYKLSNYDLSKIDLVISTIPIHENLGVPVQVVHTFLSNEDVDKITQHFYLLTRRNNGYIDPSRIFIHRELDNKKDVIQFLCHVLYMQKLVQRNYADLVFEREHIAPTCFGNLVAIPHSIISVTEKTFWTICTLKRPISWAKQQKVQFVCLLNIEKQSPGKLDEMYQKLISIIENQSLV